MARREKIFIAVLAGIIVALAAAFIIGRAVDRRRTETEVTVTRDTVYVRDTVLIDRPVEVSRRVVQKIYVPVTDTLSVHDTLYVVLPRESREYADTSYRAYVSGYEPRLDSIYVYPTTAYINTMVETVRTQKPKRWGVGVTAGYGISTQGLVPYIGVGISYNLVTF